MRFLAFLIFFSCFSIATAQKACIYSLSGKIQDEQGQALPGATLFINEKNTGVVSDERGFYEIKNLCKGTYHIDIKFLGYKTLSSRISVNDDVEEKNFSLQPDEKILNEVVVSEAHDNVNAIKSAVTISGKQLDEVRGKTLGETLQQATGVASIQTGPSIFKPVIHGVHSQRILILNNGIRQEGQQWGAEHAPEIDPFVANNITVVKDAGAIKYGTDALGGVVIVNPAELPTDAKLGGSLHLMGATNGRAGTVSGMLEGGIPKFENWGWRVQGTIKRAGDYHAPDYNLTNTGMRENNFSAAAGYHTEQKGLEFFYSRYSATMGILRGASVESADDLERAIEREPPQFTEPFSYTITEPRQEVTHDLFKINGHLTAGKNLFRFQYGFQYDERLEFDIRAGDLSKRPALGYKLFTNTLDFEVERSHNASLKGNAGVNLMYQDNNKIDNTRTIPFIPNFSNLSAGFFATEKYVMNKFEAEAGVRFDYRFYDVAGFDFLNRLHRSSLDFKNLSATLGAKYHLNNHSTLTSNVGSTWRPPNVAELYSAGTHQSAAAIEYGLFLDKTTSFINDPKDVDEKIERALKWVNTYNLDKGPISLEVSGYINYIFNYIYLKPEGVTQDVRGVFPYFRYTQTDASFLGADVSVQYTLSKNFLLNARSSLLQAKDQTNDDYLIWIPANRAELSVRYQTPGKRKWKNFFLEPKAKFVGRQARAPRVISISEINQANQQGINLFESDTRNFDFAAAPLSYWLAGLSSGISVKTGESQWRIQFNADNIFNRAYREYTNRMRYYADDLASNYSLSINFSF